MRMCLLNTVPKEKINMIDVTDKVRFGEIDSDFLSFRKCVCGETFDGWNQTLDTDKDDPWECPKCKRKFIFLYEVTIYQIGQEE